MPDENITNLIKVRSYFFGDTVGNEIDVVCNAKLCRL